MKNGLDEDYLYNATHCACPPHLLSPKCFVQASKVFTGVHFAVLTHAEVAELVDALDSGSSEE